VRRTTICAWLAAVLGGGALGCPSTPKHFSYPDDPLFVSKKPVEGKADKGGPALLAAVEPAVPPAPTEALVYRAARKLESEQPKPGGRARQDGAPAPIGQIAPVSHPPAPADPSGTGPTPTYPSN
jgi:hypothetical protein